MNNNFVKVPLVCGSVIKPAMPMNEKLFRERIKKDVQERLSKFTFAENMAIVFTPIIIAELAWHFALKAVDGAAKKRIDSTKKLCRTMRFVRETFLNEYKKDLDAPHLKRIYDSSDLFIQQCSMDLMLLWFSVNNDIKKNYPSLDYVDIRTDAYISLVVLDVLDEHNKRMDELITEKVGRSKTITNPLNDALRKGMEAFIYPINMKRSQNVINSMKIIHKNLSKIKFDVNN